MKKIINYLFIAVLFISATSCLSYKEVQISEVHSVKILKMDESTADVEVALKVSNPNKTKITIKDCNLDAFVNKKFVGKVCFDEKVVLPKRSENIYPIIVKADMKEVKKLMPGLVFSNSALLNVKGDLKVKAHGISKKIKIDQKEKISRNDLKSIMMTSNK